MRNSLDELIEEKQQIDEQIAILRAGRSSVIDTIRKRKCELSNEHAKRMAKIKGPTAQRYAEQTGKIGSSEARDLFMLATWYEIPTSIMDMVVNAKRGEIQAELYHGRWLFDPEEVNRYAVDVAAHGEHPYSEGSITNRWSKEAHNDEERT